MMILLDQTEKNYGPCGCIGKQGDDPHCPCEMRSRGLERKSFVQPITPSEKAFLTDLRSKRGM